MNRVLCWVKWLAALTGSGLSVFLAIVYGKRTAQVQVTIAKEKAAKARHLQAVADHARADADRAESAAEAEAHREKADTLILRVAKLEEERTQITGDLTKAAKELSDADYVYHFNRRHVASGDR